jgi:RNA polymerase sigma factor (sigma-70 family)
MVLEQNPMTEQPASHFAFTRTDSPASGATEALSDGQLLKQYVERRDEEAFTVLVQRFGPLVLSVCQRTLGHQQDAEDVFQATFLVLARKANNIVKAQAIAAFLCRVAYRMARKLKRQNARRFTVPMDFRDMPANDQTPELIWRDLRPVLDEEVDRLPRKYRLPFVLCYLQGLTYEQAAKQLGCPMGTLGSWLAQARQRLSSRLARRGIALSSGLLAGALTVYAGPAPMALDLATVAVRHALVFAQGTTPVAAVAPAAIASGYLHLWSRVNLARKVAWVLVPGVGLTLLLLGLSRWWPTASGPANQPAPPALPPREDLNRLQGPWTMIDVTINGLPLPPAGVGFQFEGNSCQFVAPDGSTLSTMTFTLDPTQDPKQIDLTLLPQGSPALGIYELSGDELRLCYYTKGARPREFASRHENEQLYRFGRSRR